MGTYLGAKFLGPRHRTDSCGGVPWHALAIVGLLVACGHDDRAPKGPWARCRAALQVSIRQLGPIDGVIACRDLLRPDCRDAMKLVDADLSLDDGRAVVARCAAAYCPIADQPLCTAKPTLADATRGATALFATALAGVSGASEDDRRAVGTMLAAELLPVKALVARCTVADGAVRLALDGGGAWAVPEHASADDLAPFVAATTAADGKARGVLVWGADDLAPDARRAFFEAMHAAQIELVLCARDGRNCR